MNTIPNGWPARVLYLHGFRSSPLSAKARFVRERLAQDAPATQWLCPQLPASPAAAMALILELTACWPRGDGGTLVMGSSLGGFYAVQAAHALQARAVLLNPAVSPERDLARHLGLQTQWHDPAQRLDFRPEFLPELQAQQAAIAREGMRERLSPTSAFALITQGDEVLDWREMHSAHASARCHVLPGGDHAISDFAQHWPLIAAFIRQPPETSAQ
ncbi:YqiA/YcfP family alpha/beta fold hydrolase [Amphibiibacter pelophylacis]|uniref:YqiA/YcfP family alpha/beta fold hydrolase n=1 Tax=Amphibiibacter pelophylacis TaxID=1799477 RepID=A0ACC6P0Q8_9BURK